MKRSILNLIIFQVGWLVCVLGGDLIAVLFTIPALVFHHYYIMLRKSEWRTIGCILLAGSLWDAVMTYSGVLVFADASPVGIPIWLICLWLLFATTFQHSLSWLSRHPALAVVCAGILGPASYWGGARLTEAQIGDPFAASLVVIAIGWSVLFPLGLRLAARDRL